MISLNRSQEMPLILVPLCFFLKEVCIRVEIHVNSFPNKQWFLCTCLQYKSFENTVGKGEIARDKQYLLFPQCFLPVWITFGHFQYNLQLLSACSFSLEESKIRSLGKGLP